LPERISDRVLAALARKHLPPNLLGADDSTFHAAAQPKAAA
jgi:hypothetical protein